MDDAMDPELAAALAMSMQPPSPEPSDAGANDADFAREIEEGASQQGGAVVADQSQGATLSSTNRDPTHAPTVGLRPRRVPARMSPPPPSSVCTRSR